MKSSEVQRLIRRFEDGRVKIFEINKALEVRSKEKTLFQNGIYIPLRSKGSLRHHIIAFCRKEETRYAVIIAPRFLANLIHMQQLSFNDVLEKHVRLPSKRRPKSVERDLYWKIFSFKEDW